MGNDFLLAKSSVAIVGLGLMGGSMAMALNGHCRRLLGIDAQPSTVELAVKKSIVDLVDREPGKLIPMADIIILALPIPSALSFLEKLPAIMPKPCIVLDLSSTKRAIIEAMAKLPERFDPIGGHPICGKEQLQLSHAEGSLYFNAPFILSPLSRTSPEALSAAEEILSVLGARPVLLDPSTHDRVLATVSHLPFLLASALAHITPQEYAPFIGPGFRSSSRLAATPSGMMMGVLQTNRDNILNALKSVQEELERLSTALINNDYESIQASLESARENYKCLLNTDL